MIVGEIVERITGQTLEQVMGERIFEPIGMHDTLLRRRDTDFVPNSSTPHMINAAGQFEKWNWMDHAGQGGIVSTTNDMLRWLAHMDAPTVGSAETWELMKAPQTLRDGTATGYGLGLLNDRYRGVQTIHHAGGWLGAGSQMLKVPSVGLDVTIMTNHGAVDPNLLVRRILDACLPDLEPVRQGARHSCASGVFRSPTSHRVIQLFAKDGPQIASIGGFDLPFAPDEHGVLRLAATVDGIKQPMRLVGDAGRPSSIRLDQFGNFDELFAVEPAGSIDIGAIVGRYWSQAAATEITIGETGNGPQMRTVGRFGSVVRDLECLAQGIWRARNSTTQVLGYWGGVLAFDSDGKGFRYSTLQTWSLPFQRVA
jgi:hypothetical protein